MEKQVSTVVCPNCGANTTNLYNCEYCGSILVRYVAAGKEVDNQTFGKEVHIISGLVEALGKNLSLQKIKNEDDVVLTEIITPYQTVMQVIDTPNCNIGILTANPFGEGHEGEIALRIPFETMSEDNGFAEGEKLRLSWFKQQDYYFMFTQQNYYGGVIYYINFGKDSDNAAKLLSAILSHEVDTAADFRITTQIVPKKCIGNASGVLTDNRAKNAKIITIVCVILFIVATAIREFCF